MSDFEMLSIVLGIITLIVTLLIKYIDSNLKKVTRPAKGKGYSFE